MTNLFKAVATLTPTGIYSGASTAIPDKLNFLKNQRTTISFTKYDKDAALPPTLIIRLDIATSGTDVRNNTDLSRYYQTSDSGYIQMPLALRKETEKFLNQSLKSWRLKGTSCFVENPSSWAIYLFFTDPEANSKGLTDGQVDGLVNRMLSGSVDITWEALTNANAVMNEFARLVRPAANNKKISLFIPKSLRGKTPFKFGVIDYDKSNNNCNLTLRLYTVDSDPHVSRLSMLNFSEGSLTIKDPTIINDILESTPHSIHSRLGLVLDGPKVEWRGNYLQLSFSNIFRKKDMTWNTFDSTWKDLKDRKGIYVIYDATGTIIDIGSSVDNTVGAKSRRKDNDHPEATFFTFWELPPGIVSSQAEAIFIHKIENDLIIMAGERQGNRPKYNHASAPLSQNLNSEELVQALNKFSEHYRLSLPYAPTEKKKAS